MARVTGQPQAEQKSGFSMIVGMAQKTMARGINYNS